MAVSFDVAALTSRLPPHLIRLGASTNSYSVHHRHHLSTVHKMASTQALTLKGDDPMCIRLIASLTADLTAQATKSSLHFGDVDILWEEPTIPSVFPM